MGKIIDIKNIKNTLLSPHKKDIVADKNDKPRKKSKVLDIMEKKIKIIKV